MGLYKYWGMIWVWKWILLKKDFHKWWRWKGFSMLRPYFIHIYIKNGLYITHIQTNYPPLEKAYKKREFPTVIYRLINSDKHPSLPQLSYRLLHKRQKVPIYLNLGQQLFYTIGNLKEIKSKSAYLLQLNLLRTYKIRKKRITYKDVPLHYREIGHKLYEYLVRDSFREENYIKDLQQTYPLSYSHLLRIFKLVIGVPPSKVRKDRRLINFKKRLLDTNHPIQNLVLDSGFKSRSHLYQLFQETYEMSPQKFRKKYQVQMGL